MDILIVLTAIALVFIVEGVLPFLSPPLWRKVLLFTAARNDQTLRLMGAASLLAGTVLMYLVHSGALG